MTAAVADELVASDAERDCLATLRDLVGVPDGPIERHSVRVFLFAERLARGSTDSELLLCAALLHDGGLYPGARTSAAYVTDGRRLAEQVLGGRWPDERVRLCADAVEHHHELVPQWRLGTEVELVRRADLVEVTHGLVRFGLPRRFFDETISRVPRDGFAREVGRQLAAAARERPGTMWRIFRPPRRP